MTPRLIYTLSIRLWKLGSLLNRIAKLPLLGPVLQPHLFDPDDSQAVLIPVQEAIRGGESVVLPYHLLPALIERAGHRAALHHCMCREAERCNTYPTDLGCLFLGAGAAQIDPALARPLDVQAALAHVERAMAEGLMPTILHATLDAFMLQIPFRRMVAICFCCECCCTIRQGMRLGPPAAWETVMRLPGLSVRASEACVGCGVCVTQCPVHAITLKDGQAIIGDICKGCGRCVNVCPSNAISLHIDDEVDVKDRLLRQIESRTEIRG